MNTIILVVKVLTALFFLLAGFTKLSLSHEQVIDKLPFAQDFKPLQIKLIGLADAIGALGLILPLFIKLPAFITPAATLGLICLMIGAIVVHKKREETKEIFVNLVLLVLCIVILIAEYFV